MAEAPDREELDEELGIVPSAWLPEVVRAWYDTARLQQIVRDVATQAERLQALVFMAMCVLVAMVPMKMVEKQEDAGNKRLCSYSATLMVRSSYP